MAHPAKMRALRSFVKFFMIPSLVDSTLLEV